MISIVDGFFTDKERKEIFDFFIECDEQKQTNTFWIDCSLQKPSHNRFNLKKIIETVNTTIDLTNMIGCECWIHKNTRPESWHFDKDEVSYNTKNELYFPICSTVYYPKISGLKGGRFLSEKLIVNPVANRFMFFPPGVFHAVEEFDGERTAIAINFWNYKIKL